MKKEKLRWEDIVEKMNFTDFSRKSWNLLKKLGTDAPQIVPPKTVTADNIASQMCFQGSHRHESCLCNENINTR
jgi:hypothetical protein